jgi:hypothetical protein
MTPAAALQDPVMSGVVMYDLVNEPDNKKICEWLQLGCATPCAW